MERLMRLVVAQGETIQTQLRRLQEREHQIEQYEQQMHLLRVQNLGTDYLLHSYLKDDQSETKDENSSEEKSNDSGVVTEEVVEAPLSQSLKGVTVEEEAMTAAGLEEIQEFASILARMEEINTRILHEEETLASMSTTVSAAYEQQKDEAELLQQELMCVSHIHAQLVADVRQNEQTLRETEAILWEQRKQLELLLKEDTESDQETRALRQHLDYIIHLPPSAFRLPAEEISPLQVSTTAVAATTPARVPSVTNLNNDTTDIPYVPSSKQNKVKVEEKDAPPPLPSCPPPIIEEDEEDDIDSAKNSSLCVSSRSSTSSEASTSSATSNNNKTPNDAEPNKSTSTPASSKTTKATGKDTDSTDSNSDTGLSSLHSSSDEGVYVLDTLV